MVSLYEAKKKPAKGKSKDSKPKVEKAVQDTTDPNTGQPMEVTKPAMAMTGNPANPILVYPTTGGQSSVVDPRNPMRQSQVALLQSHTEKRGMLLHEYIDYARGKIVSASGDSPLDTPPIPTEADRNTGNLHKNQTGNIGMDNTGSEDDSAPGPNATMGDVNQRLRRRAGKRTGYTDPTGVWGGDDVDYAHTEYEDDAIFEGFKYAAAPRHVVPNGSLYVTATVKPSADKVMMQMAKKDGTVMSTHGPLNHKAGDAIITSKEGHKWTVRGDIFKKTYKRNLDGSWSKKAGIEHHGYIAQQDHEVKTLEGTTPVKKGDLVLRGVKDEWWAQNGEKAKSKYDIKINEGADFYTPVARGNFDGAPVTHDGPRYRIHQWGSTGHVIVDKQKNQTMWITPQDHDYITHTMIGRSYSTPKMDMESAAGAFWNDYKNKRHVRNLT